ncbi:MAG: hypothetical protein JWN03_6849 [Nocardia sp.]|uniref:DUF4190 domain-containing protein n=1 Tax=Nocardia sp. TaxID=1821 RepID=UPI0026085138|nr:DUF4190 domain-containing protein [Nocardia sp.]MCU1646574.1 hypothetical protein [Nocardia sp.]
MNYPPPYGYQGYPAYGAPRPDHPQATTILVLGILSLVFCQLLGPVAWIMGSKARKEIEYSEGMLGGRGNVMAGYVCGIIATCMLTLAILIYGGIILFAVLNAHNSSY